jgi:hypothetical protein
MTKGRHLRRVRDRKRSEAIWEMWKRDSSVPCAGAEAPALGADAAGAGVARDAVFCVNVKRSKVVGSRCKMARARGTYLCRRSLGRVQGLGRLRRLGLGRLALSGGELREGGGGGHVEFHLDVLVLEYDAIQVPAVLRVSDNPRQRLGVDPASSRSDWGGRCVLTNSFMSFVSACSLLTRSGKFNFVGSKREPSFLALCS